MDEKTKGIIAITAAVLFGYKPVIGLVAVGGGLASSDRPVPGHVQSSFLKAGVLGLAIPALLAWYGLRKLKVA